MTHARRAAGFIPAVFLLLTLTPLARGDGSALRLVRVVGPYQVAVFASPALPSAGPVDISVLVQDTATGRARIDLPIRVIAHPLDGGEAKTAEATTESATNKLFRAALIDFDRPGEWRIVAHVGESPEVVEFPLEIVGAAPRSDYVWWIGWPLGVVALFAAHQWLAARRRGG